MIARKHLFLLSILSGALLFLAWPPAGYPLILFFAFVPLLRIEDAFSSGKTAERSSLLFWLSYLAFFIWNVSTTWWVYNASVGGAAMAILANSLLMSMVFWLFHISKKRLLSSTAISASAANWLFPVFWIAFEYFHHRWELTWPWLTLGNAFAKTHTWIQWYEYTGTPGGSLWALSVNLLFFQWLTGKSKSAYAIAALLLLPIALSLLIYSAHDTPPASTHQVNVVVVQPNIDPYSEKFGGMNFEEQLNKMLDLAKLKVDSTTDYLVLPETALTEQIWENEFEQTTSIPVLRKFLTAYPRLKIITGASTWYLYEKGEKLSESARKFKQQDGYYDAFNTALQIDSSGTIQVYHKSKLVPGVERMPYPAVFGFLEKLAIDLGGTSGSLGTQEERTVFFPPARLLSGSLPASSGKADPAPKQEGERTGVAPVVCYESIYGEYVGEYIRNGATLIFIITNDGWWLDTPGYRQHLLYGRLRAIETRKCIARSANTGISCFINERGDFLQETEWWKPAVIQGSLDSNSGETFYVKYGDLIGKVAFYASGILLLLTAILRFARRKP